MEKPHTQKTTATDTPAFTLLLGRAARRHPGGPYPDPDTRLGRGRASSRLGGVTADGRRTRRRGMAGLLQDRAWRLGGTLAAQGRSATAQATNAAAARRAKGAGDPLRGSLEGRSLPRSLRMPRTAAAGGEPALGRAPSQVRLEQRR